MTKEEQAILSYFIHRSEDTGKKPDHTMVDFDDATLAAIQEKYHISIDANNKSNVLNKLLSHEYIQHSSYGVKYFEMKITPKGISAIRYNKEKEEQLANRSFFKKLSDGIESYKGLATVTVIMMAGITLILKYGEIK